MSSRSSLKASTADTTSPQWPRNWSGKSPPIRIALPSVSASGLLACLKVATTWGEIMRAADTAMYEAKHRGKGQYRFHLVNG